MLTATYGDNSISNPALGIISDRSLMLRFEFKHLGDYKYKTSILDSAFGTTQVPR